MYRLALFMGILAVAGCDAADAGDSQSPIQQVQEQPIGESPEVVRTGPPTVVSGTLHINPGGIDFGDVAPKTTFRAELTLINVGGTPITITEVQSSCGCTVPEDLEGAVIAAGTSMPFATTFTSPSEPGPKDSKVLLKFNDGSKPRHALITLHGNVTLSILADPPYVDALKGKRTGTVTIRSQDGQPFRVISSNEAAPVYADGFNPASDKPRSAYTIQWALDYPTDEADCGRQRIWWPVETDHPDCGIVPLRIRHECTGVLMDPDWKQRNWIFLEYIVNLDRIKAGKTIELEVALRNWDGIPVYAVESLSPDATAELVSTADPPGETTTCKVRFTPRAGYKGLLYAMVNFKSDTGDMDIPFIAQVE